MVLPLIAAGALVSVGTAAYTAYQQGKISKEAYQRQKSLIEDYKRQMDSIGPNDTPPTYSPELMRVIGTYEPEIAQRIQEETPELIQESASGQEKQYQKDVLSQLSSLSQTGDDAISRAQREEAAFEADAATKRRRNEAVKQMTQRGLGGSGADILAQIQGGQDASVEQRRAALQAAANAQSRRYDALNQLGSMAGQVRGQNTNTESANKQIMNSFRQRTANARQNYEQAVAETRNDAQRYNLNVAQSVADANVGINNRGQMVNQDRQYDTATAEKDRQRGMVANMTGMQQTAATSKQQGDMANNAAWGQVGQATGSSLGSLGTYYDNKAARDTELEQRVLDRQASKRG